MKKNTNVNKSAILLRDLVSKTLDEMKGNDILAIPVTALTSITDYMILCTATSDRHAKALARSVADAAAKMGIHSRTQGEQEGEWVLVDLGDTVIHVMLAKTREYYNLEALWSVDAD